MPRLRAERRPLRVWGEAVSLRDDLIRAGYNPDATNDRGYECPRCGYEPTNWELDNGSRCPECGPVPHKDTLA